MVMTNWCIGIRRMVGAVGFEPYDPLIKSQLLYQLSYAPPRGGV